MQLVSLRSANRESFASPIAPTSAGKPALGSSHLLFPPRKLHQTIHFQREEMGEVTNGKIHTELAVCNFFGRFSGGSVQNLNEFWLLRGVLPHAVMMRRAWGHQGRQTCPCDPAPGCQQGLLCGQFWASLQCGEERAAWEHTV